MLSSDGKFELFKINLDNKDSLLKKLLKQEKRRHLKRTREERDTQEEVKDIMVDK